MFFAISGFQRRMLGFAIDIKLDHAESQRLLVNTLKIPG